MSLAVLLLSLLPSIVGLLALLGDLLGDAAQRALDARVDVAFARAQPVVLGLQRIVAFLQRLHFAAHRFDLADQRGHGVARGVAGDAQGFGLFRAERGIFRIVSGLAIRGGHPGFDDDQHDAQQDRRHKPFQQAVSFHDWQPPVLAGVTAAHASGRRRG
ncbi:hypothetical protein D3C80_1402750 [compost metagenome]